MIKHLIFFHGGGSEEDYLTDAQLVASLKSKLGSKYIIHYPLLTPEDAPDYGRRKQIIKEISSSQDDVILVAHSLGASMLLACLSEVKPTKKIAGVFLLSTPFWTGDEEWVRPLKLQPGFAKQLDKEIPLFFYQCRDDHEVPFDHFMRYQQEIPWATFREISVGGHQYNNDLTIVANDIKKIGG